MCGYGPICWSIKKQASRYLSSAEVEYKGVVDASIHEVWLHVILTEFGIHTSPSVTLFCDNYSAVKISSDHVQKQQTRNIEVHMHYI